MLFEHLADKLSPFLLDEKYHPYDIPTKKQDYKGDTVNLQPSDTNKYMMYDFYVLDYLKFLVDNMSPKQFRDLPPDLEDSVQDAVKKLFPHLREELLNALFYAMCSEFRNSTQTGNVINLQRLPKGSKERQLYADWLKYMRVHRGDYTPDDLETLGVEDPSSDIRAPELEKLNSIDRNLSYKAANYSIKQNGSSKEEFVKMMKEVFETGQWNSSYGGDAWGGIADGWLSLNASEKLTPTTKQGIDSMIKPMSVAIDHVYDLQHNTDTVFNKLKSYYNPREEYRWIKDALDDKANVKSYHDLLEKTSGAVKSMALPVLYNRLGTSWEEHVRKNRPEDLYNRAAEEQKAKEAAKIKAEKEESLKQTLQQLKDKNAVLGDDEPLPDKTNDYKTDYSKWENGDFIKCIDSDGYYAKDKLTVGQVYIIVGYPKPTGNNQFFINVVDTEHKMLGNFNTDRFINVSKKGNKSSPIPTNADLGITPKKVKHDFKVGDKVKRKGTELEGEIVRTYRTVFNTDGLKVKLNDGTLVFWKPENTEHVPTTPLPESKYKVGDRVIYTVDPMTYHGHVKEIKSGIHSPENILTIYLIELQGPVDLLESNPMLKKAPRTFKQKFEDDIPKVGDDVVVVKDGKLLYGTLSDMTSSGTKGWVDIPHISNFNLSSWFPIGMIKKDTSKNHVNTNDTEELQTGDDVFVYSHVAKLNFFGILSAIDHVNKEGHVEFPPQFGNSRHSEWFPLSKIKKDIKI